MVLLSCNQVRRPAVWHYMWCFPFHSVFSILGDVLLDTSSLGKLPFRFGWWKSNRHCCQLYCHGAGMYHFFCEQKLLWMPFWGDHQVQGGVHCKCSWSDLNWGSYKFHHTFGSSICEAEVPFLISIIRRKWYRNSHFLFKGSKHWCRFTQTQVPWQSSRTEHKHSDPNLAFITHRLFVLHSWSPLHRCYPPLRLFPVSWQKEKENEKLSFSGRQHLCAAPHLWFATWSPTLTSSPWLPSPSPAPWPWSLTETSTGDLQRHQSPLPSAPSYGHSWKKVGTSESECDIRMDFDTNEYPNIFVSRKWHERMSEYICIIFFDTNEYPNIFVLELWYERISE